MEEDRKLTKEELKQYVKDRIPEFKRVLSLETESAMSYIESFFAAQLHLYDIDPVYDDLLQEFMHHDNIFDKYGKKKRKEVEEELFKKFEEYANS
ncbi:hypothetical protein [Streptobacillus ratti]|uniref:hypothetical protein n=1 Tax=Streptobacillus ratti TaxID=1720557 RepID=UPI000933A801|nr:hypothetical protein [Streptobacillus ratti]